MKYLQVSESSNNNIGTSYIYIKNNTDYAKNLTNNWTLEFFVNKNILTKPSSNLSIFEFQMYDDKKENINKLVDIFIPKSTDTFNITLNNDTKEISKQLLEKKWNHVAIVYAKDYSLIVYINAIRVIGDNYESIDNKKYAYFKQFLFTLYKKTNIINYTKIRFYDGIKYNSEGFEIDYPDDDYTEDKNILTVILPSDDIPEDTVMPIVQNALYKTEGLDVKAEFKFQNKNRVLEDTANQIVYEGTVNGNKIYDKNFGFATDTRDDSGDKGFTSPLYYTPNNLNIVDTTNSDDNYYELYDVIYKFPTFLHIGDNSENRIWLDIDNMSNYFEDELDINKGLTIDILLKNDDSKIGPSRDGLIWWAVGHKKELNKPRDFYYDGNTFGLKATNDDNYSFHIDHSSAKVIIYRILTTTPTSDFFAGRGRLYIGTIMKDGNTYFSDLNINKYHHFCLSFNSKYIRAKVDGVDTSYDNVGILFHSVMRNIEKNSLSISNYSLLEGKMLLDPSQESESYDNYPYDSARSFLRLMKNSRLAYYRISRKVPEGSFDATNHLFQYPYDFRKFHNSGHIIFSSTFFDENDDKFIDNELRKIDIFNYDSFEETMDIKFNSNCRGMLITNYILNDSDIFEKGMNFNNDKISEHGCNRYLPQSSILSFEILLDDPDSDPPTLQDILKEKNIPTTYNYELATGGFYPIITRNILPNYSYFKNFIDKDTSTFITYNEECLNKPFHSAIHYDCITYIPYIINSSIFTYEFDSSTDFIAIPCSGHDGGVYNNRYSVSDYQYGYHYSYIESVNDNVKDKIIFDPFNLSNNDDPDRENKLKQKNIILDKIFNVEKFSFFDILPLFEDENPMYRKQSFPIIFTSSITRERNLIKLINHHPVSEDWSVLVNIFPLKVTNVDEGEYYDLIYVSSLYGKGYMGIQVRPADGSIRINCNSYYPYSSNINKINQIMSDTQTTSIFEVSNVKMKINEWNRIVFVSHNSGNVSCGESIKNGWHKIFINKQEISISGTTNMDYLHRIFMFTRKLSVNNPLIPIYCGLIVSDSSENT